MDFQNWRLLTNLWAHTPTKTPKQVKTLFVFSMIYNHWKILKKLVCIWSVFWEKVVSIWSVIQTFFFYRPLCHHWLFALHDFGISHKVKFMSTHIFDIFSTRTCIDCVCMFRNCEWLLLSDNFLAKTFRKVKICKGIQ